MSFIERIKACNRFNGQTVLPFIVGGQSVGWINKSHGAALQKIPHYFKITDEYIHLTDHLQHFEERTRAMAEVVSLLREKGIVSDWRSEWYPVAPSYHQSPLFAIERSVAPFFGVKTYGTHLNGYFEKDHQLWVWVAQRAPHLKFAPGKLDNVAAGGLPLGLSAQENMRKEAREEAKIPDDLLQQAQRVGAVSYLMDTSRGVTPDTMFLYDLKLPPDFVPETDGAEVSRFIALSLPELADRIYATDDFKYNSALVMLDFLIRHGAISPDHPEYAEVILGLRWSLLDEEVSRW